MKFINETVVQGGASEFIQEATKQKGSKVELTQEQVGFLTDFEDNELVSGSFIYRISVEDATSGSADGTIRIVKSQELDGGLATDLITLDTFLFDFVIKD